VLGTTGQLVKSEMVTFSVEGGTDPDGDELRHAWYVQVVALEDGKTYRLTQATGPNNAEEVVPGQAPISLGSAPTVRFNLPLRGTYTIEVEVKDTYGATRRLERELEVSNQAPTLGQLYIERDPRAVGDRVPDYDQLNPIHAHYYARLQRFAQQPPLSTPSPVAYDPEGDLSCDHPVIWEWSVAPADAGTMEYAVTELATCNPVTPDDVLGSQFFFRLLPSKQQNATVKVTARVPDRFGAVATVSQEIALRPNRPPCIEATQPSFANPQVVVLQTEGRRFEATSVSEDVPESLKYTWLVRDKDDAAFSTLPGQSGQAYQLPAGFRTPGAEIELRLIVEESGGQAPSCALDAGTCASSPSLPGSCYQWVTWKVVFQ
jgi:hypothetical protein